MQDLKRVWSGIGWLEATALVVLGVTLALVLTGQVSPVALAIWLVLGYFGYMARSVIEEAQRFQPTEPPTIWAITLWANLGLMALGLGSFGWYLVGGGSVAWIPFLVFVAGMIGLRSWRRSVTARLYAWRIPALKLLQKGEYRQLVRQLEDEATAGRGHPDKLAMVALAYIEMNKLRQAENLIDRAMNLAPTYASVNGALGSLRRHQARYDDAVHAIQAALVFEDNANSRYYLGLCQYLAGDTTAAQTTLRGIIDHPDLMRQGQVYGAFILGQIAEEDGDSEGARDWYARLAEDAPRVLPTLEEEARRHKQTPYAETLKSNVRAMQRIVAQRPVSEEEGTGAA
ncbi:MAG: hypothetical protein GYB65_18795 [Chloroflexi bacterium]|nr:hypothetical protein [Chloroflexota bacterium]